MERIKVRKDLACNNYGFISSDFLYWLNTHFKNDWAWSTFDDDYLSITIYHPNEHIVEMKLRYG